MAAASSGEAQGKTLEVMQKDETVIGGQSRSAHVISNEMKSLKSVPDA